MAGESIALPVRDVALSYLVLRIELLSHLERRNKMTDYTDLLDGLIPVLKKEYPNEWFTLPDIRELAVKWNTYIAEFRETKLLPQFPFNDEEKEYLQSSLLDGLYEIRWVPILVDRRKQERKQDLDDNFMSLKTVCEKGYLRTAQFLYSAWKDEELFIGKNYLSLAFKESCEEGHLQIAQWLASVCHFTKNTFEYTAISSCQTGQFGVVKWLCTRIDANSIVIDMNLGHTNLYNILFQRACYSGCLELAKWLLAEYPKIQIFSSYARGFGHHNDGFVSAYFRGHREIVEWLWSLRLGN